MNWWNRLWHTHQFDRNEQMVAVPIERDVMRARQCVCGLWGLFKDGRLQYVDTLQESR